MSLKGGDGDPNSWSSWDEIPDGTTLYAAADNTMVVMNGSKSWVLAEGSGSSSNQWVPYQGTITQGGVQGMSSDEFIEHWETENPTSGGQSPLTPFGEWVMSLFD